MMLDLKLGELSEQLAKLKFQTIAIQLPAGLRQKASEISTFLERLGYTVIVSGDPSYGACDVADEEMRNVGAQILVHFGHSKMIEKTTIPVIYWEVEDSVDIVEVVRKNIQTIKAGGKRVGLLTTVQHVKKLYEVKHYLDKMGFDARIGRPVSRVCYPGQVLGCSFETTRDVDVDFYLFLGTGYFHAIGVLLATNKKVFCCDPYSMRCENVSDIGNKLLKKRYAMMNKSRGMNHFGIVVSTKRGQFRLKEAKTIQKLLSEKGKKSQLIFAREVSKDIIWDFDFDAYIIAACPRIAIDNAPTFEKPVLTITEAKLLFGKGAYLFDEIR
ncbi:MAG: diphthamide biosynthesis enzyme Dph2 [Candidatus Methanofastidiosia archaeon]